MKINFLLLLIAVSIFAFDVETFVKHYSENDTEEPTNMSYESTEIYTEYEDEEYTEVKGRMISRKKFTKIGDSLDFEIIEETLEGEFASDEEDESNEPEEDVDDSNNGLTEQLSMDDGPFSKKQLENYIFEYDGTQYLNTEKNHIIRFKSKKKDKEHFNGRALFGVKDSLMYKIEMEFADRPMVIKDFKMTMTFDYPDGFAVTTSVSMRMWVKVFLLHNSKFEVNMTFSNYIIQ